MDKQIKLPNIDFANVGNILVETGKNTCKFVVNHAPELLACALACLTLDNIRVRVYRKKDQKAFNENALKQQEIIRKHEAEINVLKDESEQAQKVVQRINRLTQIVNSITEGSVAE